MNPLALGPVVCCNCYNGGGAANPPVNALGQSFAPFNMFGDRERIPSTIQPHKESLAENSKRREWAPPLSPEILICTRDHHYG